jgi:hypothetical protein
MDYPYREGTSLAAAISRAWAPFLTDVGVVHYGLLSHIANPSIGLGMGYHTKDGVRYRATCKVLRTGVHAAMCGSVIAPVHASRHEALGTHVAITA